MYNSETYEIRLIQGLLRKKNSSHVLFDIYPVHITREFYMIVMLNPSGSGRVEAMKWLVENGYPPTTVCPRTGDSCLHFALLRLLESCPYLASKKFEELVKVIKPALESPDRFGNTVMHLCCDMLQKGMPRKDFYMAALDVMCQYARQTTPGMNKTKLL